MCKPLGRPYFVPRLSLNNVIGFSFILLVGFSGAANLLEDLKRPRGFVFNPSRQSYPGMNMFRAYLGRYLGKYSKANVHMMSNIASKFASKFEKSSISIADRQTSKNLGFQCLVLPRHGEKALCHGSTGGVETGLTTLVFITMSYTHRS